MLTALGGPGRLAFGALIGAAGAALLATSWAIAGSPSALTETEGGNGEIVVVKRSEQPSRTVNVTGTTASSNGSATTTAPSSSSSSTTTTTETTTTTTTTTTTATTTVRPTTTTTRRPPPPTTTTTTTTTPRQCGLLFC